jgi:hypothetical protein
VVKTLITVHIETKARHDLMPVNALTTEVGFRVGPVVLETLIKHYFDRLKRDTQDEKSTGEKSTRLRQDELLYDEVFNVVKVRRTTIERLGLD